MLLGRQRVQSEDFLVQLRVGLFFSMLKDLPEGGYDIDDRPIKVQTGLPPEFIVQDSEELRNKFVGEHRYSVKVGKRPWVNVRIKLDTKDVFICKQPFGTLMASVINSDGVMTNPALLKKNVLILDAGFHTTDTFHCIQGTREGIALTWENYAMQEVYQRTCDNILEASGNRADISVYSLEKAFETGVVHYGSKKIPYDFTKDFYRNLKAVCVELLDELNTAYNSMMNVDVILLTGGTGVAWEKYIREYYKETQALDAKTASRANVTGYYNLLVSRSR